ncbi:MAG: hypothetical protein IJT38_06100 [Clostridia bacterium]|nr:hypothetical protein [Clostridia bacterium]
MKEKIYTIPLTEALKADCECPLCEVEKNIDIKTTQYFIGPAMMEPDTRSLTNSKGFCRRHYDKMLESGNKLSLALILQTRLNEVNNKLAEISKQKKLQKLKKEIDGFQKMFSSCAVCEKVADRMNDCIDNFLYLLKKEPDFRAEFLLSKGLCMKHFNMLVPLITDNGLLEEVVALQVKQSERIKSEIDKFCLKFDYRSTDLDIEDVKDSPARAVYKLRSLI